MKTAAISEIKRELKHRSDKELLNLCLRLAKLNRENKELLTYLLFETHDEEGYISAVKKEISYQMITLNINNMYLAKKTISKALLTANKYIQYSGSKQTAVEVLMHFCAVLKACDIPFQHNRVLANIYNMQLKKIRKNLKGLHEDLQHDYELQLQSLEDVKWYGILVLNN